jgi:molybdopterin molybdotransferase
MLITPEQALRIVISSVRPASPVLAPLGEAFDLWLAQDIRADRDQPPADRSAMDGYAVRAADLAHVPGRLRLIGEVAAGSSLRLHVRAGSCAVILTGGNLPRGGDTVVPIEQTERAGGEVIFLAPVRRGSHIRRRGEEAQRGHVLLTKGTRLGPAQIGVCAMVGKARVKVYPRPRVAVICTGAEVRDATERVSAHELRDSNGPALQAAMADCGFPGATRHLVTDSPQAIASCLMRAAKTAQVVILTGGVSVGQYDFVPEAVGRVGGRIRFHGVNMKPGQPQLYATLPGNRHVFGLPGNPVSVLTGFHELLLPALRKLGGASEDACRPACELPLAEPARSKGNRAYFALARLIATKEGPAVAPVESAGSADLIAACKADGVIVIPAGITELPAGAMVEFHAWKMNR